MESPTSSHDAANAASPSPGAGRQGGSTNSFSDLPTGDSLDMSSLDDVTELEPLPPSVTNADDELGKNPILKIRDLPVPTPSANAPASLAPNATNHTSSTSRSSRSPTSHRAPAARYVTISAVLSRSGAIFPLDPHSDQGQELFRRGTSSREASDGMDSSHLRKRRAPRSSGFSSGSALEALGALWLHRDSKGRATSLSSQRWANAAPGSSGSASRSLTSTYRAFVSALREVGSQTFGLELPGSATSVEALPPGKATIAERRARRRLEQAGDIVGEEEDTVFVRIKTRRSHPTFEVSRNKAQAAPVVTGRPHSQSASDPVADPRAAFRRAHSSAATTYSANAAFGPQDPLDAPPSPVGMPGDWPGGRGWRSLANGGGHEDAALLLPPPLLDDNGSSPQSFEGLLGVRRRREQEAARKRLERLAARNRPPHKVGMLTALTNFVKAAHAADQASKAAHKYRPSRPRGPVRRHTEASELLRDEQVRSAQAQESDVSLWGSHGCTKRADLPAAAQASSLARTNSLSRRTSLSSTTDPSLQPLETVPESDAAASQHDGGRHPPQVSSTRRSSIIARLDSASSQQPHAPRLLPIQMEGEPSPFTPQHAPSSATAHDYLSARSFDSIGSQSLPRTPQIGPTMLTLPPSPWTSLEGPAEHQHTFALNLMSVQSSLMPLSPRLAPTHLSLMPSPFPSAAPSRITSPRMDLTRSPLSMDAGNLSMSMLASPPFEPLDGSQASKTQDKWPQPDDHIQPTPSVASDVRLTPAQMLGTELDGALARAARQDEGDDSANAPQKSSDTTSAVQETSRITHHASPSGNEVAGSPARHPRRSFLLWWFIGDLGLGTRSALEAKAYDPQISPFVSWTSLVAAETIGFTSFCLVHIVGLIYEVLSMSSMAFWFLRWVVLNLCGQTVLSRCIIDAYGLIAAEWALVAAEDHEDSAHAFGGHFLSDEKSSLQKAGLSKWQVLRGIIEVICLQSVTRERWIGEGAGLTRIHGWQRNTTDEDTAAAANGHLESALDDEDEEEDEEETDLIITRRDDDILEFTRTPRLRPQGGGSGDSANGGYFAHAKPNRPQARKRPHGSRALVKKLKWASRLAVGAYGLHVHIVDLPPTFTPSGNRFTRQTFAHLSRLSDPNDVLHADIQQMTGDEDAYQPTFYVARDHVQKMIVVAVRGTQSFSDIIADLDMRTERFQLPGHADKTANLTCHAGVLRAAQGLVQPTSSLFQTVSQALAEHDGFGLTLVGHSLGAAIASAVALLLGHYDGDLADSSAAHGTWHIRKDCGLPEGRAIQAISLASPATFSTALSAIASMGETPLVTSVVLGADIIPRAGHGQARELRRILGALSRVRRRLTEKQMQRRRSSTTAVTDHKKNDDDPMSHEDARVYILRSWWRWRSLRKISPRDLTRSDRQHIKRIESQLWKLRCDVEADLYTATKHRATVNHDDANCDASASATCSAIPPSPWVGPRSAAPLHQVAERRQALDSATLKSEAALGGVLIPAGRCYYIEQIEIPSDATAAETATAQSSTTELYEIQSPASFFSLPEFVTTMFAAHLPSSYEAVIEEM